MSPNLTEKATLRKRKHESITSFFWIPFMLMDEKVWTVAER